MKYRTKKLHLEHRIASDTGIVRVRNHTLDMYAQERAREIRAAVDPTSTDAPPHLASWDEYWPHLPAGITTFGENLHWNYGYEQPVKRAAQAWKQSPHHWANEINTKFTQMGLGITRLVLPGDEDFPLRWRWYFVALYTDFPKG